MSKKIEWDSKMDDHIEERFQKLEARFDLLLELMEEKTTITDLKVTDQKRLDRLRGKEE